MRHKQKLQCGTHERVLPIPQRALLYVCRYGSMSATGNAAGGVIKGWDIGVATMKKGEKAVLTCKSEYAYGAAGSPPKIPADATLNFEV